MALVEQVEKTIEKVTGLGRPGRQELPALAKPRVPRLPWPHRTVDGGVAEATDRATVRPWTG
jgi:hypothetical protein